MNIKKSLIVAVAFMSVSAITFAQTPAKTEKKAKAKTEKPAADTAKAVKHVHKAAPKPAEKKGA